MGLGQQITSTRRTLPFTAPYDGHGDLYAEVFIVVIIQFYETMTSPL